MENHGGDVQAREMKIAIEAIGRDVIGVCLDSGNPVWMLEDPHIDARDADSLRQTCHVRDSAVWKVPEGIAVRWVNMGDGNVDIDGWIRKFIAAKPGLPIIFENLVSGAPRVHKIYDPAFWDNWRKMPASEFSRFLAVAEKGKPTPAVPRPEGKTAGSRRSTISKPACATRGNCSRGSDRCARPGRPTTSKGGRDGTFESYRFVRSHVAACRPRRPGSGPGAS